MRPLRAWNGYGGAVSAAQVLILGARAGDDTGERRFDIEPRDPQSEEWPSLTAALSDVRSALRVRRPKLRCALLPPLAYAKSMFSRDLSTREYSAVIKRDIVRYFPFCDPQESVVYTYPSGSGDTTIVGAASNRTLDAIRRSCAQSGWNLEWIVPAEMLWWKCRPGSAELLIPLDESFMLLSGRRSRITSIRRLHQTVVQPTQGTAEDLAGLQLPDRLDDVPRMETPPALVAAKAATVIRAPHLLTRAAQEQQEQASRKAVLFLLSLSLALFLLTDVRRVQKLSSELRSIQEQREAIRTTVSEQLRLRERLLASNAELEALTAETGATVIWSEVLVRLSTVLPDGAFLTRFETRGDSIILDGMATDVIGTIRALQATREFASSRLIDSSSQPENGTHGQELFAIVAGVGLERPAKVTR